MAAVDPLTEAIAAARTAEHSVRQFELVMESFVQDFAWTPADIQKLWDFCTTETFIDHEDAFTRMCEIACREYVLRAIRDTGMRRFWRPIVQYDNRWVRQRAFRSYFECYKLSKNAAEAHVRTHQASVLERLRILQKTIRESARKISPPANKLVLKSFKNVNGQFAVSFSDAYDSLKQYAV